MNTSRGFTLLELAIVLIVIAFIVAGILSGKTLIRQAEIRSVLQEYDRHLKATKEFYDKYQAMPGDFSTAETLWGTDGTCPNNTYTGTVSEAIETCNGDGNSKIGDCKDTLNAAACTTTYVNEIWRVWQHLANAGLVDGRFTGRAGGSFSSTQATPGLNVPASKLRPGGWTLLYYINVQSSGITNIDQYGHVFLFGGGRGGASARFTTEPVLYVTDAYQMDKKIDDGYPLTGTFRAWNNYFMPDSDNGPTAGTATNYCVRAGTYYVPDGTYADKLYVCSLIFIPGF